MRALCVQDANRTEHSIYVGCGVCGKYFHTDPYLDAHFDRKHQDLLVGHACLADHCTVLQCPSMGAGGSGEGQGGDGVQVESRPPDNDPDSKRDQPRLRDSDPCARTTPANEHSSVMANAE